MSGDVLPGCCGVFLFDSISGATENSIKQEITAIEDAAKPVGNNCDCYREPPESKCLYCDPNDPRNVDEAFGMMMATTSQGQKKEVQALRRCGFRMIGSFRNPKTGNRVKVWGRYINQPKKRKNRK